MHRGCRGNPLRPAHNDAGSDSDPCEMPSGASDCPVSGSSGPVSLPGRQWESASAQSKQPSGHKGDFSDGIIHGWEMDIPSNISC